MATFRKWGPARRSQTTLHQDRIVMSRHARKTILRIGTGADPETIVRRCLARNVMPPDGWHLLRKPGFVYRKYGDHAMIFSKVKGNGARFLITVVGPFVEGMIYDPKRHRLIRPL